MEDLLKEFCVECNEGLAKLDQDLVRFEKNSQDLEVLKNIFRLIHSIKGTGGMLGLSRLEKVAHAAEDVLGKIRDGQLTPTSSIFDLILKAIDSIKHILNVLENTGKEPAGDDQALIDALRSAMQAGLEVTDPAKISAVVEAATPIETTGRVAAEQSLRVSVDVLDRLMNLVGELVLSRNQLIQLVRGDDESRYLAPIQHLNRIASGLQESVMQTRMQPIGNAWNKLPRIVRDLTSFSGKQIELVMTGQETEIDRQVLQAIQDPLVHCVRNSGDHGIESPAERAQKGKAPQGTIRLNAFHEGGHIVIEISDDGSGINAEKVKSRAIQRNLITAEAAERMSEQQIYNLIFEPGFSTAEKVTELSGRGVGMDVVKTNVEQIGGAVELLSQLGKGTTVRIKIPLTLAIISALIVKVGAGVGDTFAIPQVGVVELVRISESNHHLIEKINTARVLRLRDKLLPLLDLGEFLGYERCEDEAEFSIVVAQVNDIQFGLVVREIFDTQEIVVKPIGRVLRDVNLFAGSTILGDGRVVIILDLARISARSNLAASIGVCTEIDKLSQQQSKEDKKMLETASLLLFRVGNMAPMAVPLALVTRLEEFKVSDLEEVEGQIVVQYRDGLLPILTVPGHEIDRVLGGTIPTVIFSENNQSMGLAVTEVTDIVESTLGIESRGQKPGALGSTIIRGKATEMIDTNYYLQKAYPDWFGKMRSRNSEKSKRILLVEDSKFFQNLIRPVLESAGYQVVVADDGALAMEELRAGIRPDLVLSDIEMPKMDGYELIQAIRKDPSYCHLRAIALTSLKTEEAKTKAMASGFDEFMTKFDRQILLDTVGRMLFDFEARDEKRAA